MIAKDEILKIKNWLELRNQRERFMLLAITLFLLYIFWGFLLEGPATDTNAALTSQIAASKMQTDTLLKQKEAIITAANQPPDPTLVQENKQLKLKLDQIDHYLNLFIKEMTPASQMLQMLRSLVGQTTDLSVSQLQNSAPTIITSPTNALSGTLYRHDIVFEFQGNYIATLNYLRRLEATKSRFFWDSLSYQVVKYPNATTLLKLHTLSDQESLLDV